MVLDGMRTSMWLLQLMMSGMCISRCVAYYNFCPILSTRCCLQAHPKQKKWCKTAFPLFNDIADLIEGTYTTGRGVVQPGKPTSDSSGDKDDNIDPTLSQPLPSSITPASSNVAPSAPILATPVVATIKA
jgi:hypothetical protein